MVLDEVEDDNFHVYYTIPFPGIRKGEIKGDIYDMPYIKAAYWQHAMTTIYDGTNFFQVMYQADGIVSQHIHCHCLIFVSFLSES